MNLDIGCSFAFGVPVATHAVMLFEPHSSDLPKVVDSSLEILGHAALPPSSTKAGCGGRAPWRCGEREMNLPLMRSGRKAMTVRGRRWLQVLRTIMMAC